mmetsp:Transcript_32185/g.36703  ORF Transcript_32185/g.36703 Transcript_32185/m.36703 type:complete len:80 (+) Transcript_32185:496-735(+)
MKLIWSLNNYSKIMKDIEHSKESSQKNQTRKHSLMNKIEKIKQLYQSEYINPEDLKAAISMVQTDFRANQGQKQGFIKC